MQVSDLLVEAYGRLPDQVRTAVEGLDVEQLHRAPAPGANTVAWTVWHLIRVQDHHVSEVLDQEQLWVTDGWAGRFGRAPDPADTGYGHAPDQVATLRAPDAQTLIDYFDAVHARTLAYLRTLTPPDLDRIVDERWDPPVTLGVRLVSVVDDDVQHAGQAAYVRGLLERS
jgi:uncharacterized damage-inducible protein DinB